MKIPGETGYEEEILAMQRVGWNLPEYLFDELQSIHKSLGCNAHSEGLYCCLDFLLGDFKVEL